MYVLNHVDLISPHTGIFHINDLSCSVGMLARYVSTTQGCASRVYGELRTQEHNNITNTSWNQASVVYEDNVFAMCIYHCIRHILRQVQQVLVRGVRRGTGGVHMGGG